MTSRFRRDTMSWGNSSSFSMSQNQEKKQIPRYEVRFTNKNHPFMWLVCKTRTKILLSDPETSLTTPRLLPLRRSGRTYGNYQSSQSSGSSRNILKRLGDRTIIWKPGLRQGSSKVYGIRDQRSARGWDQGSQP